MEGRKRSKALHFDPSDPCRKPCVQGSNVMDLEEKGVNVMPYVGRPPAMKKEPRRSSRCSIPTDFYHDSEKQDAVEIVAASVRKEAAAAAVKNEGCRHSSRQSVPTDFYIAGLHDAITRSAKGSPKKKRKQVIAQKSQMIPKKKTCTIVKHKITLEEAVIQMERYAQEEEKKPVKLKRAKTKEFKKNDSNNEKNNAVSLLPKKERGHFASPMVLIPLSECIPPPASTSPKKVRVSSPRKQKVIAEKQEKKNGDTFVKRKKRRRKVIPAALRRKHQVISVLVSAGTEVAQPKKQETLNEVQVSSIGDDIPNQAIASVTQSKADKVKKTHGAKKPKKKHNGFKNKIGKLVRSVPVKRKQKKIEAARPEALDSGESDWADAEGDDGFDDDTIDAEDEKESTERVIPAPDNASVIKESDQTAMQPKRKKGRPRKSDRKDGKIDERWSTEEATQMPDDASATEKMDQIAEQPEGKRGRPRKPDRKDGGIDEKMLTQEATQAPDNASAVEKGDQTIEQPKRKRGRPRKSDQKDGKIDGKESTQEATHAPDFSSVANNVGQTASQPKKRRGRPRKDDCGNDELKSVQPKRGKGRPRRYIWKDCGKCLVCQQAENCGRCESCLNMTAFGGDGSLGAKCVLRVCITPIVNEGTTTNQSKIRDTSKNGNDRAVSSSDAPLMESSIDCNQGVTRKEASVLRDSGVESLSDNDSMAVDDMSDLESDDGYKGSFTRTITVAPMAWVAEYGAASKLTQVGSLSSSWTAANAEREGQLKGGASHMGRNAFDSTKGSDPTTTHPTETTDEISSDGKEICADSDQEMNPRGRDEKSQQDAAELARKLLRYERMQYLNDDASYENSGDEDYLMVPPPPPCE